MYINCLWVSGQFKGQGYSNLLLKKCIMDSKEKGKRGVVILSSKKKMGYLSDYKYLTYKGFETADTAPPYFELMYLNFDKTGNPPQFKSYLKDNEKNPSEDGFTLYYTSQCPFTAFSLFYHGEFITHEILSEKKFEKILESKGH